METERGECRNRTRQLKIKKKKKKEKEDTVGRRMGGNKEKKKKENGKRKKTPVDRLAQTDNWVLPNSDFDPFLVPINSFQWAVAGVGRRALQGAWQ